MSPGAIPENVETLALELAHRENAAKAMAVKNPKKIVRRLMSEARAKDMSIHDYLLDFVQQSEGVTPPEGTATTSAFWSFGLDHPEAPKNSDGQNFLDNRYIAEAWAHLQNEERPGSAQTLETTEAGRRLNDMRLWEPEVLRAINAVDTQIDVGGAFTRQCWADLSKTYATAAEGPVAVFAQSAHTRSILHNDESPTLQANANVGLDNINFAFEAPANWPETARSELGTNAVRATAQFDDPSRPRYIDPAAYATYEPEVRKEMLSEVLAAAELQRQANTAEAGAEAEPKTVAAAATGAEAGAETAEATAKAVEAPAGEAPTPRAPAIAPPDAATPPSPTPTTPASTPTRPAAPPLWQAGFTPRPTRAAHGSSGPAPTAAPEPISAGKGMDGPT
ncbi:hypothetical protein [Streptomyces sp. cmx-18-6]|uniref:hypothetical protein n=1 Tax=Streptomyces sp. cmx-18-6 TaxID=2790930 RepID=UPI00397EB317